MDKKLTLIVGIATFAAVIFAVAAFAVQSNANDPMNGFDSSASAEDDLVTTDASEMANGFLVTYNGEYVANLLNPIDGKPIPDFSVTVISENEAQASTESPMPGFLDALFCRYTVCSSYDEAMGLFGNSKELYDEKADTVVMDAIYYYAIEAKGSFSEAYGVYGDSPAGSFMMGPWVLLYYSAVYKNVYVESTFFVSGKNYADTDFGSVIDAMFKGITDPVKNASENTVGIRCCPVSISDNGTDSSALDMAKFFFNAYKGKCLDYKDDDNKGFSVVKVDNNTAKITVKGPISYAPELFCKFTVYDSHDEAYNNYMLSISEYRKPGDSIMGSTHFYKIPCSSRFSDAYGVYGNNTGWMGGDWFITYYSAVYENVLITSVFYLKGCFFESIDFDTVIYYMYGAAYYGLSLHG